MKLKLLVLIGGIFFSSNSFALDQYPSKDCNYDFIVENFATEVGKVTEFVISDSELKGAKAVKRFDELVSSRGRIYVNEGIDSFGRLFFSNIEQSFTLYNRSYKRISTVEYCVKTSIPDQSASMCRKVCRYLDSCDADMHFHTGCGHK